MVKLRLHGEIEEINQFVEFISTLSPQVRILSCSGNYKDRGASVYTRVYMDLELHTSEKNNRETEIAQRILKDVRQEITACQGGIDYDSFYKDILPRLDKISDKYTEVKQ